MTGGDSEAVADSEIAPHIGGNYDGVKINSPDERRAAMQDIYNAVNQGKPVGVSIRGASVVTR